MIHLEVCDYEIYSSMVYDFNTHEPFTCTYQSVNIIHDSS